MMTHLPKLLAAARAGEQTPSSAMLKASIAELQRTMYTLQDMMPKANDHEQQMIAAAMNIVSGLVRAIESSQDAPHDAPERPARRAIR
jgi:precorrin-4 methylase